MLDGRAEISRPGPDSVSVGGTVLRSGSRVVLHPRTAATDVLMRAIDGRRAIVDAVMQDVEDQVRVTVTLEDDPVRWLGKAQGLGHRFFFDLDELEPVPDAGPGAAPRRILVAGIGNVFLGDDGFGVAVARRLEQQRERLRPGVEVVDFGIRGMDLAYALAGGYDAAILIDVAPRGQAPGTLEVIEPEIEPDVFVGFEAHAMDPVAVLQFAQQFGPVPARTLVVGCEPERVLDPDTDELLDELTPAVSAAVDRAVALIENLTGDLLDAPENLNQGGPS